LYHSEPAKKNKSSKGRKDKEKGKSYDTTLSMESAGQLVGHHHVTLLSYYHKAEQYYKNYPIHHNVLVYFGLKGLFALARANGWVSEMTTAEANDAMKSKEGQEEEEEDEEEEVVQQPEEENVEGKEVEQGEEVQVEPQPREVAMDGGGLETKETLPQDEEVIMEDVEEGGNDSLQPLPVEIQQQQEPQVVEEQVQQQQQPVEYQQEDEDDGLMSSIPSKDMPGGENDDFDPGNKTGEGVRADSRSDANAGQSEDNYEGTDLEAMLERVIDHQRQPSQEVQTYSSYHSQPSRDQLPPLPNPSNYHLQRYAQQVELPLGPSLHPSNPMTTGMLIARSQALPHMQPVTTFAPTPPHVLQPSVAPTPPYPFDNNQNYPQMNHLQGSAVSDPLPPMCPPQPLAMIPTADQATTQQHPPSPYPPSAGRGDNLWQQPAM